MLSSSEYSNIISYLTSVTNYTKESLLNKPEENLFRMYNRIKECMNTYPLTIIYLQNSLDINGYSLSDLKQMDYHELLEIKNELLNKRNRKNRVKLEDTSMETEEKEYIEPILISPDDLYIGYLIDYHNYTQKELLDLGFVIIDREQDTYLTYIRDNLRLKLIEYLVGSNIRMEVNKLPLERLIELYFDIFVNREDYVSIDDMVEKIKLEKRYKNE